MKPQTSENEIREQAFKALTRQIGCKMTYQPLPDRDFVDGRVELQLEHGKYLFNAEVKARITGPDTLFP